MTNEEATRPEDVTALQKRINAAERLAKAVETLDFSDTYTLSNAEPMELIRCTRPIEVWAELIDALREYRSIQEESR